MGRVVTVEFVFIDLWPGLQVTNTNLHPTTV